MAKQLILNQIEITNENTIQLRFNKLSSDGDIIGYHRTAIINKDSVDVQIALVNTHMSEENYDPISQADIDKVKKIANVL